MPTQGEIAVVDESDGRGRVPLQFEQADAIHWIECLRHCIAWRQDRKIEQQSRRAVRERIRIQSGGLKPVGSSAPTLPGALIK
jgi:hypothetical protein